MVRVNLFASLRNVKIRHGINELIFRFEDEFILEPGVTVLKGDNGIGKTQLLKLIIGSIKLTDSNKIKHVYERKTERGTEEEEIIIKNTFTALKNGFRFFFQGDRLFDTLGLTESVLIFGQGINKDINIPKLEKILQFLGGQDIKDFLDKRDLSGKLSVGQQTLAKLAIIFYDLFKDNTNVSSIDDFINIEQLKTVKVIILDEVLSSLHYRNRLKVIRFFQLLQRLNPNLCLIVVTHNPEELIWWKPRIIYEISKNSEDKIRKVRRINSRAKFFLPNFINLEEPMPIYFQKGDVIDIFPEVDKLVDDLKTKESIRKRLDTSKLESDVVYIVDTGVKKYLNKRHELTIIEMKGGEDSKNMEKQNEEGCLYLIKKLSSKIENPYYPVCVIGGGATLNSAGFACSIINRGLNPLIYVPTTPLSASDVALGSKTACNLGYKHKIGTYHNPDAVILWLDIIHKYIEEEGKRAFLNLAENYKHFLFQDKEYLDRLEKIVYSNYLEGLKKNIEDFILHTISLKSEIIIFDFYEKSIGKILLFGHLWARLLETVTEYKIPHDVAVWIGMYIDFSLTKQFYKDSEFVRERLMFIENSIFEIIREYYGHFFKSVTFIVNNFMENIFKDVKKEAINRDGKAVLKIFKIKERNQFMDLFEGNNSLIPFEEIEIDKDDLENIIKHTLERIA